MTIDESKPTPKQLALKKKIKGKVKHGLTSTSKKKTESLAESLVDTLLEMPSSCDQDPRAAHRLRPTNHWTPYGAEHVAAEEEEDALEKSVAGLTPEDQHAKRRLHHDLKRIARTPSQESLLGEDDVFLRHQLNIARRTLGMNNVMARAIGGMTKAEAAHLLKRHGSAADHKLAATVGDTDWSDEVVKKESLATELVDQLLD